MINFIAKNNMILYEIETMKNQKNEMVNYNKIKNWNEAITKNKNKLKIETDFKKKEKLRYKIQIDELKVKIERLN